LFSVQINGPIQMHQSFQLNLWTDFLAGRVPRRKNFAGSFKITPFYSVKQGFFDDATYSQEKVIIKSLSNFYRAAQNHIKQSRKSNGNPWEAQTETVTREVSNE